MLGAKQCGGPGELERREICADLCRHLQHDVGSGFASTRGLKQLFQELGRVWRGSSLLSDAIIRRAPLPPQKAGAVFMCLSTRRSREERRAEECLADMYSKSSCRGPEQE